MTGLTRPVTRDLQKVLTRLKMQQQAVADGRPIPEDRTDVMDLPHLFKPTSAGLHHAARKLGENPLPEEEPGVPIPGIFGPMDRQPTAEEEELGIFRVNPPPHRVRPATGDILPPEIEEAKRAANEANEARERKQKEEQPAQRPRQPEQRTDENQGKTATTPEKGKDDDRSGQGRRASR